MRTIRSRLDVAKSYTKHPSINSYFTSPSIPFIFTRNSFIYTYTNTTHKIQFSSAFSIFINFRSLVSYRSTRCLLLATNSKCYRQSSPVTGDYRTRKTDQPGASAKTTSIANNLRCLNVKCLLDITKIR